MIRYVFIIIVFLTSSYIACAQEVSHLTLEKCYDWTNDNYPMVKQYELLDKTRELSLSNLSKGYFPQVLVAGQASYQSDVTSFPLSLPNISVPTLDKDQYKIYVEVNQSVTDLFFTLKHQKDAVKNTSETEKRRTTVELHKVKERVSDLFFGILLIDTQISQNKIVQKDLQQSITKTETAIAAGTTLKSNADVLHAELLKVKQQEIDLIANKKSLISMLSLFVGKPITETATLELPSATIFSQENKRAELQWYDFQKNSYEIQKKLISDKAIPKLSLFLQGGYGKPALNILNPDFDTYYIGGVRLSWNLSAFYTHKKELQLMETHQNSVEVQRETFLLQTELSLKQKQLDIERLESLIKSDKELIALREKVKKTAQNQLEHGTITTTDYLTHLNSEDQAQQQLILHEISLLKTKNDYKLLLNN